MPLVVGVFQSADYRRAGADQFGELLLSEASPLAKGINFPRNAVVSLRLRQLGDALGMTFIMPPMNYLDRVGYRLPFHHKLLLLECVKLRRLLISLLSRQRRLDSRVGNSLLLGQSMREDRCDSAVKEVENPVVDVPQSDSQFVDAVTKKVGFRTPQLMSQFCEPLNPDSALVLRLGRQAIEPIENWHRTVHFAIENDRGLRHAPHHLANFAKLRKRNQRAFNSFRWSIRFYRARCLRSRLRLQ